MKKIAIVLSTLAMAVGAFGQGAVFFNNRVVGTVVAPIYGVNPNAPGVQMQGNATTNGGAVDYTGVPLLLGTGFSAALFAGPDQAAAAASMTSLQTIPFRTVTTLGGFVQNTAAAVSVPGVMGTGTAPWSYQVRAWNNLGGTVTTWADALANPSADRGVSAPFTTVTSIAPTPAGNLVGLTSFNLVVVPEPSLIALGALGLGALLLRRRKA